MAEEARPRVHGDGGAWVGGDWVDVEDCAERFNIQNGSGQGQKACASCPRSRSRHCAARRKDEYDVVIVGAGCIGSAIARELSKSTASVLLLEAADDVTQGATKGNSGIVHAGYDDKPGSVRARYCWPGNQMFPQLDRELHFGFQRNGSLVVATSEEECAILDELMQRGEANGVQNLRIVDQDELRELEPDIDECALAALHSPDAGTITPYEFTIALAENAVDNGVEIRTRRKVVAIDKADDGGCFTITTKHWEPPRVAKRMAGANDMAAKAGAFVAAAVAVGLVAHAFQQAQQQQGQQGQGSQAGPNVLEIAAAIAFLLLAAALASGKLLASSFRESISYEPSPGTVLTGLAETEVVKAHYVVNAAGCTSDQVAAMVGDTSFRIKPRMGDYILLHKDEGHKARHVLFPTPHPVYGKGCLVQSTLWGNLILGPTARDTMRVKDDGTLEPNPEVLSEAPSNILGWILSKSRRLVPSFDPGAVIHTFAGARAKNTTGDWVIGPVDGVPGFINAAAIDSPGIAAAPAIALDVVRLLREAGAPITEENTNFNPNRAPIIVPKGGNGSLKGLRMSKNDPWKVKDPKQNIICKCERVTEAEVVDACHRSLPIDSTQAIRKRTRAGMGHCQGDPENYDCEMRVATIMARELGCPIEDIGRRPFPASSLMKHRFFDEADKEGLRELSDPSRQFVLHGAAR